MIKDTNIVIGTTVFILLFGVFSNLLIGRSVSDTEPVTGSWACTTDIRVCEDGSFVNRTPPYCQFNSCPR